MRRMHNGFTLIEALIVLATASILLCVAVWGLSVILILYGPWR